MDKASLAQLIEISRSVGGNPRYVQAGGGNTSVKSPDRRTMAIKASGTALGAMSEADGWVELDIAAVLSIFNRADLPMLSTNEREARVLEHLSSAKVGGGGRPSVESALHATLGTVVIHTHSVAANALNCGPGAKALREITPSKEPLPLWIPYTDPGWRLATAVQAAAQAHKREHGTTPAVLFLESHGLFVSASDAAQCLALHNEWVERCERYFASTASELRSTMQADPASVEQAMADIRSIWRAARGTEPFARHSDDPELAFAASSEAADILASGAVTPDYIVYAGAHAALAESLEDLPSKLEAALREEAPPRLVLIRNLGAFLMAEDPMKLDAAEALAVASARIVRLASGRGGAHTISAASADFIINWESEHYRASLTHSGERSGGASESHDA